MKYLVLISVFCVFSLTSLAGEKENRPNVVLVLIDDLSQYGTTAYGADRKLGEVIDAHAYVPVEKITFAVKSVRMKKGSVFTAEYDVLPVNSTRKNVIFGAGKS